MFQLLTVILLCFDNSFHVRGAIRRAPYSFAYTALLYHSKFPHRTCVGIIITKWWILDNCSDFPRYHYQYIKVGWASTKRQISKYEIDKALCHKDYKMIDFNSSSFNARNLFVGLNSLCVHRSRNKIKFIPEIVTAVRVHNRNALPKRGHALFVNNGTVLAKFVPIVSKKRCNDHFEPYFGKDERILLQDYMMCVIPEGISYENCCKSQAVLVSDNILIGIMAWSTGCSKEFGIDPWVFTSVGHCISWISDNTDWQDFSSKIEN